MTMNVLIMFLLVIGLIGFFLMEPIPIDFIALSVPVLLVLLNPWTKITVDDALAGFSNTATVTVLAMFILSSAVQKYGFVQILGEKIQKWSEGRANLRYFIIITLVGITAALLNNTPVVAIFYSISHRFSPRIQKLSF